MKIAKTSPFLMFSIFCVLIALAGVRSAQAQARTIYDARRPIFKGSKIKYIDLAKLVFPDARVIKTNVMGFPNRRPTIEFQTEAESTIKFRNAFGAYEERVLKLPMSISRIASLKIYTPHGERLLVMFSVFPIQIVQGAGEDGRPANTPTRTPEDVSDKYLDVLAAFRVGPKPQLIDAIDVRKTEGSIFAEIFAPLLVKIDQDGFLIHNRQKGIGDNFSTYSLFTLENDQLKLLFDEFPALLYRSTCDTTIEDAGTFWDSSAKGAKYRTINLRLTTTAETRSPDCKRKIASRVETHRYAAEWNAQQGRYVLKNVGTSSLRKSGRR